MNRHVLYTWWTLAAAVAVLFCYGAGRQVWADDPQPTCNDKCADKTCWLMLGTTWCFSFEAPKMSCVYCGAGNVCNVVPNTRPCNVTNPPQTGRKIWYVFRTCVSVCEPVAFSWTEALPGDVDVLGENETLRQCELIGVPTG
jgi:hypothetical protein